MKSELNKLRVHPLLQLLALIATFASCVGQASMADETRIFRWRDAKRLAYEVDTKIFTPAERAAVRAHLAQIDAMEQADSTRFGAQVAAADQPVHRALRSLATAGRAARDGRTPHAGERIGNAGGGSRLQSEYFDRQKQLEDAIQQTRIRADEAYRPHSEIMQ